jgi:hypothetical protein
MIVKTLILVIAACAVAAPALAQEPVGCDKFKWPLDKERATLNGTDFPKIVSGDQVTFPIPFGTVRRRQAAGAAGARAEIARHLRRLFPGAGSQANRQLQDHAVGGRLDRRHAVGQRGEIDRV